MNDATAKENAPGLYAGNIRQYGAFDECLDVVYANADLNFVGKYCTYGVSIPKSNLLASNARDLSYFARGFYTPKEVRLYFIKLHLQLKY